MLKKLNVGADESKIVIQQLAQELVNPVPVEFERKMKEIVIPFSHSEKRRKSEIHQKMATIVGSQLQNVFGIWLQTETPLSNLSLTEEVLSFLDELPQPTTKTRTLLQSKPPFLSRQLRDPRVSNPRQKRTRNWSKKRVRDGGESSKEEGVEVNGRIRRLNKLSQTLMRDSNSNHDFSYLSCIEIERALFKVGKDLHYQQIM